MLGKFPDNVTATKQYGNKLKALVVALNTDGVVSVKRTHDLLCALTGIPVSTKRGRKEIEEVGFLPHYVGTLIHDCWAAYWSFAAERHGICLAHILREFNGIIENYPDQSWAKWLKSALMEMKEVKDRLIAKGKAEASRYYLRKFREEWDMCIGAGRNDNSIQKDKKTGRGKRNKARCLADRLEKYWDAAWLFFRDFSVTFENNQAERDVRPTKTKIKVSVCFRTLVGAEVYAKIQSVISTVRKHKQNVLVAIETIFATKNYTFVVATE